VLKDWWQPWLTLNPNPLSFVRFFREGDIVLLLQWCSNSKGKYILHQEIHRLRGRGSIIMQYSQLKLDTWTLNMDKIGFDSFHKDTGFYH
jgi:hypothetical protein